MSRTTPSSSFCLSLSRTETQVMRGMAIVFIMIHNFCHWIPFCVKENESTFAPSAPVTFFGRVAEGSATLFHDIFSFLGWYGVPVFIFLSGYGLVRKYESAGSVLRPGQFMSHNWLKLFKLLLPAVVILCLESVAGWICSGHSPFRAVADHLFLLTFLNDAVYNVIPPAPGVYWYFGLTLELYLLYLVAVYRRPLWWLMALVAVSLAVQAMLVPSGGSELRYEALRWLRHNFVGWLPAFALGIVYGRSTAISRRRAVAILILSAVAFFPAMFNELTWQLTPLCAIVIAIAVARLSVRIPLWRGAWVWIGTVSPFIFVVHPLIRGWIYRMSDVAAEPWLTLMVYVPLVFVAAVGYRYLVGAAGRLISFFGTVMGRVRSGV